MAAVTKCKILYFSLYSGRFFASFFAVLLLKITRVHSAHSIRNILSRPEISLLVKNGKIPVLKSGSSLWSVWGISCRRIRSETERKYHVSSRGGLGVLKKNVPAQQSLEYDAEDWRRAVLNPRNGLLLPGLPAHPEGKYYRSHTGDHVPARQSFPDFCIDGPDKVPVS